MGNCIRSMLRRLRRKRCTEKSIILLVVGLDNAGKTLVLNHISGDPDRNVLPTMGFRTVSLKHKSYTVRIYDVGGSSQIRTIWSKYYNGIHGLIYVVDASDISRLTENKAVLGELVSHEHVSGKPLLLLANKQDVNGAIDELDLVENLDVERAANTMKCPTRVETCSCINDGDQSRDNTAGIRDGYKWLLDTVIKNYAALNNRIKDSQQNVPSERIARRSSPDTPSRLSVHSNPFKPIKELVSKREQSSVASNTANGDVPGLIDDKNPASRSKKMRMFTSRNKTAPVPADERSVIEFEDVSEPTGSIPTVLAAQKSTQTPPYGNIRPENDPRPRPTRPYTAPGRSEQCFNRITVINIPGQVVQ